MLQLSHGLPCHSGPHMRLLRLLQRTSKTAQGPHGPEHFGPQMLYPRACALGVKGSDLGTRVPVICLSLSATVAFAEPPAQGTSCQYVYVPRECACKQQGSCRLAGRYCHRVGPGTYCDARVPEVLLVDSTFQCCNLEVRILQVSMSLHKAGALLETYR